MFQLVLELDHLGWKREVVTESMRKDVKKNQRMHQFEDEEKIWFTKQAAESQTVSQRYLLALIQMDGDKIKAVPCGASDRVYLRLLGMAEKDIEAKYGATCCKGRQLQLQDMQDWPEIKPRPKKRARSRAPQPPQPVADVDADAHHDSAEAPRVDNALDMLALLNSSSNSDTDTNGSHAGDRPGSAVSAAGAYFKWLLKQLFKLIFFIFVILFRFACSACRFSGQACARARSCCCQRQSKGKG